MGKILKRKVVMMFIEALRLTMYLDKTFHSRIVLHGEGIEVVIT